MNAIFDWCVEVLVYFAGVFEITYKEINVWVFVIIWPVLTLALMVLVLYQQIRIRRLQKMLQKEKGAGSGGSLRIGKSRRSIVALTNAPDKLSLLWQSNLA